MKLFCGLPETRQWGFMKIAIIAPEAAPFAKTGGLADVAGALPKALFRLGCEPILIMPLYRQVRECGVALVQVGRLQVPVGRRTIEVALWEGHLPGTAGRVYFLEEDNYFGRNGLYGENQCSYPDNCERFVLLSRSAIEATRTIGFAADVFHVHDWQTALVPPYLKLLYASDPLIGKAGTLLTIHNMAHQGHFWHWDMEVIGLGWEHFNWKEFEFWNKVNLLKGGIVFSDVVNTVSPTYALEIQTPEYGHALDGVLRERHDVVYGVVNGIDEAIWNPAADPHLKTPYGPEDLSGKAACKRSLQRRCKLPLRKGPLAGIVSRFADQKGLDIATEALGRIFAEELPLQCVVLGDGDTDLHEDMEALAAKYPDRLKLFFRYDEQLAHRIIAGADMILVPSRFEPCGLTQLYALKYGSVPVVRRTGGLNDTVCDCMPDTLDAGTATGFVFDDPAPDALAECLRRAIALYRDPISWQKLMHIGMAQDWSWEASARRYLDLYHQAKELRNRP